MDPEITWIQRSGSLVENWWKTPDLDLTFLRQPILESCLALNSAALFFWVVCRALNFKLHKRIPRCFSETNSGWGSFSSFTSVNSWSTCYGTSSANKKNKTKKKWCEGNVLWKRWWYLRTWHMNRNNFDEVHMLFFCLSARQPSVTVPYCTSCCNQLLIEGSKSKLQLHWKTKFSSQRSHQDEYQPKFWWGESIIIRLGIKCDMFTSRLEMVVLCW